MAILFEEETVRVLRIVRISYPASSAGLEILFGFLRFRIHPPGKLQNRHALRLLFVGLQHLAPVFPRRLLHHTVEIPVIAGNGLKTHRFRNAQNGFLRTAQQTARFLYAGVIHIV